MSIVDDLKRLQRIGDSTSPTFQKLTDSTMVVARQIAQVFTNCGVRSGVRIEDLYGHEYKRLNDYLLSRSDDSEDNEALHLFIVVGGGYNEDPVGDIDLCDEENPPERPAVLAFAEDIANGLIEQFAEKAQAYATTCIEAGTRFEKALDSTELARLVRETAQYESCTRLLSQRTVQLATQIAEKLVLGGFKPGEIHLSLNTRGKFNRYRFGASPRSLEVAAKPQEQLATWVTGSTEPVWMSLTEDPSPKASMLLANDVPLGLIDAINAQVVERIAHAQKNVKYLSGRI